MEINTPPVTSPAPYPVLLGADPITRKFSLPTTGGLHSDLAPPGLG